MRKTLLGCLLAALCGFQTADPQGAPAANALTVSQIAAHMDEKSRERDRSLQSYESRREMSVTVKSRLGDAGATETVLMTFTSPATKQFSVLSATGSAFLRESVFQREMSSEQAAAAPAARQAAALNLTNYDMHLAGGQHLDLGDCYVLDVVPRTTSPFAYRGRVWVQGTDFAVVRIEGQPAQDPSAWVSAGRFTTEFQKVGDFYFPKETTSSSQVALGGEASLSIRYSNYRILKANAAGPATSGQ